MITITIIIAIILGIIFLGGIVLTILTDYVSITFPNGSIIYISRRH
jgi:hypothetical protein